MFTKYEVGEYYQIQHADDGVLKVKLDMKYKITKRTKCRINWETHMKDDKNTSWYMEKKKSSKPITNDYTPMKLIEIYEGCNGWTYDLRDTTQCEGVNHKFGSDDWVLRLPRSLDLISVDELDLFKGKIEI